MAEQKCPSCCRQFEAGPGEELCMKCFMEEQARLPPQELVDMRNVAAGLAPKTPSEVKFKEMFEQRFDKFLAEKRAAERDYRTHMRELAANPVAPNDTTDAQEEAVTDDPGQARLAEQLSQEWQVVSDYFERTQGAPEEPAV